MWVRTDAAGRISSWRRRRQTGRIVPGAYPNGRYPLDTSTIMGENSALTTESQNRMTTSMTATRRLAALAIVSTAFAAPRMWADIISYSATSFTNTASLGGTTLDSCPGGNPRCVEVTVYFLADTANIVPFSVPGASGFENFTGSGRVVLFNDQTGDTLTANFDPGQIFVSVDQTNGGVGFGSAAGGPTYPLGVYGGTPSISYATYDLRSAMTLSNGFA